MAGKVKDRFKKNELVERFNAPKNKFWRNVRNNLWIIGLVAGVVSFPLGGIAGVPLWVAPMLKYIATFFLGGGVAAQFTK